MPEVDTINNMPVWAKFIAYLGFPIAVATLLLWVVVKQLDAHNHLLELHDIKLDAHSAQSMQHIEDAHEAVHTQIYIMRIMCQNVAKTREAAEKCLEKP